MKDTAPGLPASQLILDVKTALLEAGFSRTSSSPAARVASVQLVLDLVAEKSAGAGVRFCIPFINTELSLKANRSSRDSHTIDIIMVPPGAARQGRVHGGSVQDALVEALDSVRQALTAAAGGSDPWILSRGTVEIVFGVTDKGSIALVGEGELTDQVTQKLRITLDPVPDNGLTG